MYKPYACEVGRSAFSEILLPIIFDLSECKGYQTL